MSGKFKSWCDGTIPTHPHSIPEAKQSLAPPHPAKGRRGFPEKQGMRESVFLCFLHAPGPMYDSVLRVGPFAGRFAWLCVEFMWMWNYYGTGTGTEKKKERKKLGGTLGRVSWSRRTWKWARGRKRLQTGGVGWPCFACLPRALGCEWWKLNGLRQTGQKHDDPTWLTGSSRRHSTAQHSTEWAEYLLDLPVLFPLAASPSWLLPVASCPPPAACCRVRF